MAAAWRSAALFVLLACAAEAQLGPIGLSSVRAQVFFNEEMEGFPPEAGDRLGWALATGDFNGDGAEDLATGIPYDDGPLDLPLQDAGAVIVRWGVVGKGLSPALPPTHLSLYAAGGQAQANGLDTFGWALAAGDFNGDGLDDLAVGIPGLETFHGDDWDYGGVLIHYGEPGGIQLVGEHFFYTGTGTNMVDPPGRSDHTGRSLAAGDFDGDGYDDLAVGAPQTFNIGEPDTGGAVIVLHGGTGGLAPFYGYLIHQDDPPVPDEAEDPDDFGWALAAGNFNGDGRCVASGCHEIDDLAMSAPGEDGIGAVMVMMGSEFGLIFANSLYLGQGDVGGVGEANDQFGASLVAGNFDGDYRCLGIYCFQFDDLAIGTPFEDVGAANEKVNAGEVTVLFGAENGFFAWGRTRHLRQGSIAGLDSLDETGDAFGFALTAGDFNGDARDDLAIGQPGEDGGQGGVTVLAGAATGFGGYRFLPGGFEGSPPAAQNGSELGRALAAGNFDGNGFSDLAIGISHRDEAGLVNAGAVAVLYGALFADGFDGGNRSYWSTSVP